MKQLFSVTVLALSLSAAWGQGAVNVSILHQTTGATPTLTFDVSWTTPPSTAPNHRDSIWLFADYRIVNPDGSTEAWTPAGITSATLISGAGTLITATLPGRGFFLDGHGLASLNATIRITLDAPADKRFNACVYASDWPPNATLNPGGGYTLKGSPPFIINGTITEPSRTFGAGTCVTSITDATGCPGFVVNTAFTTGSIDNTGETICAGGTPAIISGIVPVSGGDNVLTYSWYKDGVLIAGATSAAYTPPASDAATAGIYTYTRKVRDNTCNITPIASTGNWVLTVQAVPTISNLTVSASTMCAGAATVTLTATASGAASYSFDDGNTWQTTNTLQVSPTTTTTYTLRVRNAGCTSPDSRTQTVTVYEPPTASVSASPTTVCAGDTVTFTATTGGGTTTAMSYTWWAGAATSTTTSSASFSKVLTTAGANTYTLRVQNSYGCYSNMPTVQTVTVNPTPTVSLTPSSASVCLGAVVTLTAAATGAIDYSFNGPNNWQAGNTAMVTVNQYNPSYTVVARSALGCTSAASTTVAVEAAPVNVLLEASNSLVCPGTAVTLTVTPTDADAYSFDNGTTWQSSHTTSVTVTGNVTYTAKARSPLGCESAAVQESITVHTLPTVSLAAASTTVCGGTLVTLTATGSANAAEYSFNNDSWQTGNTTIVTVNSTTTYTVKARTVAGCESAAAASVTIAVQAAPTVSLSAASTTVCAGTLVTLTATGSTGTAEYSFNNDSWQTGNTTNVTVNSTTTYTVKARSPLGCESAAADSVTVTVQAAPTVTLSAASTTVCGGTLVTLTATAGASSYQFNGDSWQTGNTTDVTVNSTTTYTVKARSPLGCEMATAASVTVAVQAAPTISLSAGSTTACVGTDVTLTATAGAASYQFNGDSWQTGNTTIVTVNAHTTYTAKARSPLGCETATAASVAVSVQAGPASVGLSASTTLACIGSAVTLTASGATSYSFNDGAWQTTNTTTVTVPGNVTYTVRGASTLGCVSAASSVSIAAKATPTGLTLTASSTSVCRGSTIRLEASATGANQYSFNSGNWNTTTYTNVSTPTSPNTTASTVYTVKARTTTTNCETSPVSVTVTLGALPVPSATLSHTAICNGSTYSITASGGSSYSFSRSSVPEAFSTSNTYQTILQSKYDRVYVTAMNNAGCTASITTGPTLMCTAYATSCGVTVLTASWNNTPNIASWTNSNAGCNDLGDGWRLPTDSEGQCLIMNHRSILLTYYNVYNGDPWDCLWTSLENPNEPYYYKVHCYIRGTNYTNFWHRINRVSETVGFCVR